MFNIYFYLITLRCMLAVNKVCTSIEKLINTIYTHFYERF